MPDKAVDASVIDGALCSRDDEAPWTVVWGKLPPGIEDNVRVTFRNGRKTQPAARIGLLGQHWAAEVAGRFDKVVVSFGGKQESSKVSPREKTAQPRRFSRNGGGSGVPADPLEQMKQHWGLAALILQPGSVELSEIPDLRIIGEQL